MKNVYQELGVRSVLLVGDDPWTRETLSVFLELQGCRLQSAANATEALALLSRDRFDLILCEDRLPEMDGPAFLIRSGNAQPGAVRFLITAYPNHLAANDPARQGVHDVIRKPFLVEALEASLERLILRSHDAPRADDLVR